MPANAGKLMRLRIITFTIGFLVGMALPAHAAAAYVQGCNGGNSGAATINCGSITITSGNTVACFGFWNDTGASTFTSFTKNSGTATVSAFTQPDSTVVSGNFRVNQGWASITGSGTAVFRLTISGAASGAIVVVCQEISGVPTSTPVDGAAHKMQAQAAPGTGTDAISSGSVTTTTNGDYIFGFSADGPQNSTVSAGTGYTARDANGTHYVTESQVQGSSGTIAATFTGTNGADTYLSGIMAFSPLAAGNPATTVLPKTTVLPNTVVF